MGASMAHEIKGELLDAVPDSDWQLPADVILSHGIRQRTEALAAWSQAQLDSAIDAARVVTLPSGSGYSELGVKVAA